ncbi:hypothetical protein [Phenylobacterium sp.]|uniref:helix-turn-helix transcriptional regulator n=1 Tax=Phenylobacterium sp. TaxID=1871053 RepID=UPI0025E25B9F|nr:hypothetical protein [Phenylobacterium sp.]MBX3486109.1 hypothetical protein [Phenylobacterium sp.]MCW5760985.1 hypothetical protein [Phenylobacterium sp.]
MAIIDQIYESSMDDEAHAALPVMIAQELRARSCLLLEFDQKLRPTSLQKSYFSQDMCDRHMGGEIGALDVWTPYGISLGGRVGFTEDRWDTPAFLRTPFYNEFFRAFGDDTARCMGIVTRLADGYMSLAVHRGADDRPFELHAGATLEALVPHLRRMFALRHRLGQATPQSDLLQRALDGVAHGLVIADGFGKIMVANKRAEDLLKLGEGLTLQTGRLTTTDAASRERLAAALRSAAQWSGNRGDAMRLARPGRRPALRVLVAPLAGTRPAAIVIIEDPEDADPKLETTLRRLFDLTAAEAALARMLVDGLSPEQAAEARGVRMNTVRTQIQRLLAKTEATRLSDLIRVLGRAPRSV